MVDQSTVLKNSIVKNIISENLILRINQFQFSDTPDGVVTSLTSDMHGKRNKQRQTIY